MLTMDKWYQGVPGAWALLSNEQQPTLVTFFEAVKSKVEGLQPGWRPNCFVIDDCTALANALRYGKHGLKLLRPKRLLNQLLLYRDAPDGV